MIENNISKEQNIYFYTHTVTFDEIDLFGNVKLSQIMRHTQQTAGMQLTELGFSYEFLRENDIAFLLSRYHIKIDVYPKLSETFHIKTWHEGAKGAQFIRYFNIYNNDMVLIASASSAWPIIKFSTRHIIRPSAYPYELPIGSGILCSMPAPQSIKINANMEKIYTRYIGYSVIDVNGHLNNAAYTDIICDGQNDLVKGSQINELSINYCNEVFANESIDIYSSKQDDITYFEGKTNNIVSFKAYIKLKSKWGKI